VLYPSGQEEAVETDPVRAMEMMLGIPGVRVIELDIQSSSLRVELETSATSATCPICRNEAESTGVEVVDLGVHSAMGQPMRLEWQQRQWRCPVAKCRARSWSERDKGIEEFLVRSPHRRTDRSEQWSDLGFVESDYWISMLLS
jgi:hypothetical protein